MAKQLTVCCALLIFCALLGACGNSKLSRQTRDLLHPLHVHSPVEFLPVAPVEKNGKLYVASRDGIYVLNSVTGHLEKTIVFAPVETPPYLVALGMLFEHDGDRLLAVNAVDGKRQWSQTARSQRIVLSQSEGILFAGGENATLQAIDPLSGNLLFSCHVPLQGSVEHAVSSGGSIFATVADYPNFYLVSINRKSRKMQWKRAFDSPLEYQPLLTAKEIICGTYGGSQYCVDAHDGKLLWSLPDADSPPILQQNHLFLGCNESIEAVDVDKSKDTLIRPIWIQKRSAQTGRAEASTTPSTNEAVLSTANGLVLFKSGNELHGLEAATGKVKWHSHLDGSAEIEFASLISPTQILITLKRGILQVIDTDSGKRVWEFYSQSQYFPVESSNDHRPSKK